jgi:hypothetical protein
MEVSICCESNQHTITRDNKELIIITNLMHRNIWVGRNYLLLRGELCRFLELEVADGS